MVLSQVRCITARGAVCGQRLPRGPCVESLPKFLRQRGSPHLQEVQECDAKAANGMISDQIVVRSRAEANAWRMCERRQSPASARISQRGHRGITKATSD